MKYLAAEKLDPAIMKGLDKELAVPPALLAAAKKEGKISIRLQMSDQEFAGCRRRSPRAIPGSRSSTCAASGANARSRR